MLSCANINEGVQRGVCGTQSQSVLALLRGKGHPSSPLYPAAVKNVLKSTPSPPPQPPFRWESDFANAHSISFFPLESYTYIIPPPGEAFSLDFDDDTPQAEIHHEVTFISPCALRVRFGPAAVYPYKKLFPSDAAFPPPQVRKWLLPYPDQEPPDDEPGRRRA